MVKQIFTCHSIFLTFFLMTPVHALLFSCSQCVVLGKRCHALCNCHDSPFSSANDPLRISLWSPANAVVLVNAKVVQRCTVSAARGRGGAFQSVIF